MTVKEFSKKYGIDYHTVYCLTWRIPSLTNSYQSKQYDEQELKDAIRREMTGKIERHEEAIRKARTIMNKLDL